MAGGIARESCRRLAALSFQERLLADQEGGYKLILDAHTRVRLTASGRVPMILALALENKCRISRHLSSGGPRGSLAIFSAIIVRWPTIKWRVSPFRGKANLKQGGEEHGRLRGGQGSKIGSKKHGTPKQDLESWRHSNNNQRQWRCC